MTGDVNQSPGKGRAPAYKPRAVCSSSPGALALLSLVSTAAPSSRVRTEPTHTNIARHATDSVRGSPPSLFALRKSLLAPLRFTS